MSPSDRIKSAYAVTEGASLPLLRHRIVRVVIRMGGTPADAALALGCTKKHARRVAREIGWRFGKALHARMAMP